MDLTDIATQRLQNQHLLEGLPKPPDVVGWFGAMQAQEFTDAKWAIGLRCNTTDAAVQKAFDDGKILRTHVLRPTWHFVLPQDILWVQALTSPRVKASMAYYNRKLELNDAVFKRSGAIITNALAGQNHLTRTELAHILEQNGLPAKGQKLAHLVMNAELDGLICSGAMRGKQHTYALVAERAPQAKSMPRGKALAELTKRYFQSHGPAQIADFAWWSSLTTSDIKEGIKLAKLKSIDVSGKTYYFSAEVATAGGSPVAHLLPIYDEFFIAYKDRAAFAVARTLKISREPSYADLSYNLLAIDGQLAGGWKRDVSAKVFNVKLKQFAKLSTSHKRALGLAAKRLEQFAQLPVRISEQT